MREGVAGWGRGGGEVDAIIGGDLVPSAELGLIGQSVGRSVGRYLQVSKPRQSLLLAPVEMAEGQR